MLNQQGRSRMDTVIKLALVFIISLLSFSVGTFVGKQFSDQQHKTAMLEGADSSRSVASIPANSLEVAPENALTDADIASISEEFATAEKDEIDEILSEKAPEPAEAKQASNEKPSKKPSAEQSIDDMMVELAEENKAVKTDTIAPVAVAEEKAVAPEKTSPPTDNMATDIVTQAAEKLAKQEEIVVKDKVQASRIPSSLPSKPAAASLGQFTIQIAAYQSEDEAKQHRDRLTNQGYSAFYVKADINGAAWYRVNVGLFANKAKAQVYRTQLMKEANLKSALVKKIVQ